MMGRVTAESLRKRVRPYLYLQAYTTRTIAIGGAPKRLAAFGAPNASSKMFGFSGWPGPDAGLVTVTGQGEKASGPGWVAGAGAMAGSGTAKNKHSIRTGIVFSYK